MDYEKLYKESLERAKKLHKDAIMLQLEQDIKDYEYIFPKLKESEEETIRKMCMRYLDREYQHCSFAYDRKNIEKCISWLEKQCESKFGQCIQEGDKIVTNEDGTHFNVSQLERVTKKEPKFKVGDWVVDNYGSIWKIEGILNQFYLLEGVGGGESRPTIEWVDKTYHLWTLKDAKDGDILVVNGNPFIYFYDECNNVSGNYCSIFNNELRTNINFSFEGNCITPATKEQRDLLFSKMKEAGYEWDDEKKEMKKINSYCQEHCKGYQETGKCFADGECQAKKNAELSFGEEDENVLKAITYTVKNSGYKQCIGVSNENMIDWLKSLKERMKGE